MLEEKNEITPQIINVDSLSKRVGTWDKDDVHKAVEKVKGLSTEGKPVIMNTGSAPIWVVSALSHTIQPSPVSVYVPETKEVVSIQGLRKGEINSEAGVSFTVTEKDDNVFIEYTLGDKFNKNNLSNLVVPEISNGKHVYINGEGPNYLTASVAESYANTNKSVSIPGERKVARGSTITELTGYICSITNSNEKQLGDLDVTKKLKGVARKNIDLDDNER